ncbi:MAG: acyl-protein synthetase [Candidatus Altiarchaeia archaeon]
MPKSTEDTGAAPGEKTHHVSVSLEEILKLKQYSIPDEEKNRMLLVNIKEQLLCAKENRHIKSFFEKQGIDISSINKLEDVPTIPVQMFKYFDLRIGTPESIVKVLKSSGTTSGLPSRVPLSKKTTMNQTKALNSILSDYLGNKRRLFLVIDHEGINAPNSEITARTAGVRGLSIFSKKIIYLLKEVDGKLVLNMPAIEDLIQNHKDEEVYVFGFTYIVWSVFCRQAKEQLKGRPFNFREAIIFHSGGWKKLEEEKVSKEVFSEEIAKIFGTDPKKVHDFYGMAEQTGIIFVDCEHGNKHVPNFAQVIIRDIQTLKPCEINETGLIEVMSILADSYYCQAILTEDKGFLAGIDDCPCKRKGRYFRFKSRVEKVEMRGCGDTFKEKT